ncbi:phage tail family protein [Lacticaseibacillus paracasei]|uniref:distal tail protein Dit n=2 Tax=Lacticaseibacillus paracasei TaxID=1597 RepID=UPI00237F6CDB|nr:distal tail protein Dit [Lacticaseibacillus paracasei]MDE3303963.1 phage tail family protein [Lacticaseibacillus paracasei]
MKKEITVNYGGLDLSPYFIVSNVTMPFLYKDNQYTKIGRSDGESLIYSRNAKTKITIQGTILTQETNLTVAETKDELINALKSDTIQQLTLSNYPGRYFNAIFDGTQDFDGTFDYIATVELVFTVPDGIAHSVATKTFDNKDPKWNGSPLNLLTGTSNQETSGTADLNNWNAPSQHPNISVTPGQKFAYQIFITNDNTVDLTAGVDAFSGTAWKATYVGNVIKAGTSGYSSVTFTIPSGADSIVANAARLVTQVPNAKTTVYWQEEKLNAGTTVSPWSPNPADPEYYTDTITVHNGGTYPVDPVITATMHADNGLIALINGQGGVLQFGNPEEADGVERKRSEVARYEGFDKEPAGVAYNTGQTNSHYYYIKAQKNVMEGSVKYADDDGSAVEPVFLPTNSHYWEGPSLHLKTTNASNGSNTKSFIAKWRYKFNSSVNALGAIEMTLDNDTGVAYEVIIRANYAGKDDVDVQVFAGSTLVFQQTLNRRVFSNGRYYEAKLTKLGNTLNLQLAGIVQGGIKPSEVITRNPPLVMPPITLTSAQASIPITGTTLWFQRFKNYPYPDMGVYDMDIEWLNVDYWTDLKNRFGAGDVVTIDVANRQILVNGVINTNLQMIDNDWNKFKLAPGDTLVLNKYSYWAQPYETEIAFREAFL